jgi:hypothetical protein
MDTELRAYRAVLALNSAASRFARRHTVPICTADGYTSYQSIVRLLRQNGTWHTDEHTALWDLWRKSARRAVRSAS